ncbi:MAG: c-type cytochrome [Pirellulales bacterium]
MACLLLTVGGWLFLEQTAGAADPPATHWIWSNAQASGNETIYLRKTLDLPGTVKTARLSTACDNVMTFYVNGEKQFEHASWSEPAKAELGKKLRPGKNVLAVLARNEGGPAGFMAQLQIELEDGGKLSIVSDASWLVSTKAEEGWQKPDFADAGWSKAHSLGKLGIAPWGIPGQGGAPADPGAATAVDQITALDGFNVEMLYSVPKEEQGSWVSLTPDPKGRLIVSDQNGKLYRVTPGQDADGTKVELLDLPIGQAQGLLYAYDCLYVTVNGSAAQGSGLYRLRDTNDDDQFDQVELLSKISGGGEHGPHGVRLGPDGLLYLVAGNFTQIPEGSDNNAPHRNWAEDQLLPRNPDGGGHDPHIMAPGGWVARCDKDGQNWQLLCAGLRNAYDIDFNSVGELFTYDSDMEWDTGTPWYRPTRVNHCVSGGEYGWRNGTGKWPEYSIDSLGAVTNIGLGSPTGVTFGTGAKFPAKYQHALYINDWTYGKIYAVHPVEQGATYSGTFETFISGRPLPVTDICVNHDGALYFTIGGRGTQSGLYRVTYAGSEPTAPAPLPENKAAAEARQLRHQLETLQTQASAEIADTVWPHLNSGDRSIRYAARVALEHQELASWKDRALAETKTTAALQALTALTRAGDATLLSPVVQKLNSLPLRSMTEEQLLDALRVYGLAFIRLGEPTPELRAATIEILSPLFPHQSENVNRELCQVLVYLGEPTVVPRGMEQLKLAQTQEDQLFYVLALRNMSAGWTPDLRRTYFGWLNLAETSYRGGASFRKFLERIRSDALAKTSEAEQLALKDVLEQKLQVEAVQLETTRQFIHNWQMEDLLPLVADVEQGRSFEKGKAAYQAAQCYKCHRFAGEGGATGPDLTGAGSRFNPQYLLESVIVPSRVISDQYLSSLIETSDGEVITGRVIEETDALVKVRTNPFALDLVEIPKSKIESRQPTRISEMPQGAINVLTKEEILDLIAYMRSAGNPQDKAFK